MEHVKVANRKLAVLASGFGSNLQALIEATQSDALDAEIVCVISDKKDAHALIRAKDAGIPHYWIDPSGFDSRAHFDHALLDKISAHGAEVVVLAGFMRILSEVFVQRFKHRLVNVHPALLPAFPGLNAIDQAVNAGVKVMGCTVHLVDEGVDTGPILLQEAFNVSDDDTLESIHERMHEVEHRLLKKGVAMVLSGKLYVDGVKTGMDPKLS